MGKLITIGITDCGKFANYERWMHAEEGVRVLKLNYYLKGSEEIDQCQGFILPGGDDVHPQFYKKSEYLEYCEGVDEARDAFEWRLLEYTEKNKIPALGICRGMQLANVFFGGTLIPDMEAFGKPAHSQIDREDRYHPVTTSSASQLHGIVSVSEGEINSAHHQAVDRAGDALRVNALSPDGIVEGMERKVLDDKGFLLLVQWHPERMRDQRSVFVQNVKDIFLNAVRLMT